MSGTGTMDISGTNVRQAKFAPAPLLAFLLAGLAVIVLDLADGNRYMVDVDDRMRALQIRDLLADGNWFDRTLPFLSMPEAYVSPWSRLVDLPYYLTTLALRPFLGADAAFAVSTAVWPVLIFAGFALLAARVMRIVNQGRLSVPQGFFSAILMIFALWEFVPGRIDHHNFQLTLMMAMLAGLVDPSAVRGGLVAGLSAMLSIAVGLESLPFIAVGLGALALAGAAGTGDARLRLQAAGSGFALSGLPVALALIGPQGLRDGACDALSGFWVAAILMFGAVAALVPLAWRLGLFRGRYGVVLRLVSLALPAIAAGAVLATAFPACLDGPYHMVDSVSRAFWLDRIEQEASALTMIRNGVVGIVSFILIYVLILAFAAPAVWRRLRDGDARAAIAWCVGLTAVAASCAQIRFVPFPAALVPLFLPLLIDTLARNTLMRVFLPAALVLPLLAIVSAKAFPPSLDLDVVDLMSGDECRGEDTGVLGTVPPGRVIAPLGLAFDIVEGTNGHTVGALPFHRSAPGIRRLALAFTSDDTAVRAQALAPYDYVVICRRETDFDLSSAPLFKALNEGQTVPGITPVAPESPSRFRMFRLDASVPRAFALPGDKS
ncbi:hypothetical protein [Oricola nitratireducens]|uniref:hypothetical protein n=1 Tax=Oricola nitratireducens TaxID=2775868 RepID=UPI0018682CE2|nr:hypothetical protein [Oricola nitratireducens]